MDLGCCKYQVHSPGELRREMAREQRGRHRAAGLGEEQQVKPRIKSEAEGVLCGDSHATDWQRGPKEAYASPTRQGCQQQQQQQVPRAAVHQGYTLHLPCLIFYYTAAWQ